MPGVAIAGGMGKLDCITVVDSQIEYLKAITAFRGLGEILVDTRLVVGCIMPSVTITSYFCYIYCITIVNGQMQNFQTITTMHGRQIAIVSS